MNQKINDNSILDILIKDKSEDSFNNEFQQKTFVSFEHQTQDKNSSIEDIRNTAQIKQKDLENERKTNNYLRKKIYKLKPTRIKKFNLSNQIYNKIERKTKSNLINLQKLFCSFNYKSQIKSSWKKKLDNQIFKKQSKKILNNFFKNNYAINPDENFLKEKINEFSDENEKFFQNSKESNLSSINFNFMKSKSKKIENESINQNIQTNNFSLIKMDSFQDSLDLNISRNNNSINKNILNVSKNKLFNDKVSKFNCSLIEINGNFIIYRYSKR